MGDLERLYMEEPLDHEGHARCVIYSHGKRIKHTNEPSLRCYAYEPD
jgi:hypothetical protein